MPHNVAGEATAFLKYIIDYYDALPTHTIFLHSHRYARSLLSVLGEPYGPGSWLVQVVVILSLVWMCGGKYVDRSAYHQEDILLLLPLLQRHVTPQHEYCTLNRVRK